MLYSDNLFGSKEAFLEKLLVRQMSRELPKSAVIPTFFKSGKCRVIFDTFMMQSRNSTIFGFSVGAIQGSALLPGLSRLAELPQHFHTLQVPAMV